jgi:hypothetical protein
VSFGPQGQSILKNRPGVKTYRNLYAQIISFENLCLAFRKARKGKRGRPEVAAIEPDLEELSWT